MFSQLQIKKILEREKEYSIASNKYSNKSLCATLQIEGILVRAADGLEALQDERKVECFAWFRGSLALVLSFSPYFVILIFPSMALAESGSEDG